MVEWGTELSDKEGGPYLESAVLPRDSVTLKFDFLPSLPFPSTPLYLARLPSLSGWVLPLPWHSAYLGLLRQGWVNTCEAFRWLPNKNKDTRNAGIQLWVKLARLLVLLSYAAGSDKFLFHLVLSVFVFYWDKSVCMSLLTHAKVSVTALDCRLDMWVVPVSETAYSESSGWQAYWQTSRKTLSTQVRPWGTDRVTATPSPLRAVLLSTSLSSRMRIGVGKEVTQIPGLLCWFRDPSACWSLGIFGGHSQKPRPDPQLKT